MTLRSGKELKDPRKNKEVEHEIEVQEPEPDQDQDTPSNGKKVGKDKKEPYNQVPSFPSRMRGRNFKLNEANQEILETFRKVEIKIPLLNAIK